MILSSAPISTDEKMALKKNHFKTKHFCFVFVFFGVSFIFLESLTGLHGRESMSSAFITNC